MDLRVAGKHLLDQGCARAGQAKDENGSAGGQARVCQPGKKRAVERLHQSINILFVLGRRVIVADACELEGDAVGLGQTKGGACIFTARVQDMGQAEQHPGPGAWGELLIGQAGFERVSAKKGNAL